MMSPHTTSLCSTAYMLGGVSGVASFSIIDEQLQLKLGCSFRHKVYAPLGLSPFSD